MLPEYSTPHATQNLDPSSRCIEKGLMKGNIGVVPGKIWDGMGWYGIWGFDIIPSGNEMVSIIRHALAMSGLVCHMVRAQIPPLMPYRYCPMGLLRWDIPFRSLHDDDDDDDDDDRRKCLKVSSSIDS